MQLTVLESDVRPLYLLWCRLCVNRLAKYAVSTSQGFSCTIPQSSWEVSFILLNLQLITLYNLPHLVQVVSKIGVHSLVLALILLLADCISLLHKRRCEVWQELLRFGSKLKELIDLRLIRLIFLEGTLSDVALFCATDSFRRLCSRDCQLVNWFTTIDTLKIGSSVL